MIKKFIYITLSLAISTVPLMGAEQQQEHYTGNPITLSENKDFWLPKEGKEQEVYGQGYKNLRPFHIRLYNDAQQTDFERALPTFFDDKGRPRIRIETLYTLGDLNFRAGNLMTQLLSPCLRELRVKNLVGDYEDNIGLIEMSQLAGFYINHQSREEIIEEIIKSHWSFRPFQISFLHVLGKTEADRQAAENILKENSKNIQDRSFFSIMYLQGRLNEKTKTEGLEFLNAFGNLESRYLSECEKDAYYRLGNIHERGYVVPKDFFQAINYYKKAQDHSYALLRLAHFYNEGVPNVLEKNRTQAIIYETKARAIAGDRDAWYKLFQIAKLTKEVGSSAEYCSRAAELGHKGAIQDRLKLVPFLKDNNDARDFYTGDYYIKLGLSLKAEGGEIDALLSLIQNARRDGISYWLQKMLYNLNLDTPDLLEHISLFSDDFNPYSDHYRFVERRELAPLSDNNRKWRIATTLARLGMAKYASQQLETDDKHKLVGAVSEIYSCESDDKKKQYITYIKNFIEGKNLSKKEKELDNNGFKRQAALALVQQEEFAQYARETFYQGENLSQDVVLNFFFHVIPQLDFPKSAGPSPELKALAKETKFDETFYSQFFKLLNKEGVWDGLSQKTVSIKRQQKEGILENLVLNALCQGRYLAMMKSYISSLETKGEDVTDAQEIYERFQENHLQVQSGLNCYIETGIWIEEEERIVRSIFQLTFSLFEKTFD